jgi:hypothetical protein
VQGILYVYYAVHYAVWLLLFLDTKRGLLLTVEDAVSAVAIECFHDFLD